MIYNIYTDGATSKNGKDGAYGGWAFAVYYEEDGYKKLFTDSGHIENATNQICELRAAIEGCKYVWNDCMLHFQDSVIVHSDSAYLVNCCNEKWYETWLKNGWKNSKKEPVANKELWEQLIPFFQNPTFTFNKVKGHSGNCYNELVDNLAVAAKEQKNE